MKDNTPDIERLPCRYREYSPTQRREVLVKPGVMCGGEHCRYCGGGNCHACKWNDCFSCGWNVHEQRRRLLKGRFEKDAVTGITTLRFPRNPNGKQSGTAEVVEDGDSGEGLA